MFLSHENYQKSLTFADMNRNALEQKHPWLNADVKNSSGYLTPKYYDTILKEYMFDGRSDMDLFRNFLRRDFGDDSAAKALELGSGSGRGTDVFLENVSSYASLDLVDLSSEMVEYCRNKYQKQRDMKFFQSDSIDFFSKTENKYSFVYSLWSLSHSIHQHIVDRIGEYEYVKNSIRNFIEKNIAPGGKMYIIHFDSLSEEQSIIYKQLSRDYPVAALTDRQSPSKLLLDEIFNECEKAGMGNFSVDHLIGDPIRYDSIENALEVFMNFHMHTYFNHSDVVEQVLEGLVESFGKYEKPDGIFIRPGCFIYMFERSNQ